MNAHPAADLQSLPAFLSAAMQQDPALALALTAAWLDPLGLLGPDDPEDHLYEGGEDERDMALYALSIARRCLPALYVDLLAALRAGCTLRAFEAAFNEGLHAAYPHLESVALFDLPSGLPLPFVGIEITDPDFPTDHPDLLTLLAECFGLPAEEVPASNWSPAGLRLDEGEFEALRPLAERLMQSFAESNEQPWVDIAALLGWLFSCSGASLLDYSHEAWWDSGYEPMPWDSESLALAEAACAELAEFWTSVERARALLATDPHLRAALRRKVNTLSTASSRAA